MDKVFVEQGSSGDGVQVVSMFKEEGWEIVSEPYEADLVCFVGGADVSPILSNEPNTNSNCNANLDLQSVYLFQQAMLNGIPMVGICRGGQFLNVMSGGKMIQHIPNHGIFGTHVVNIESEQESTFNNVSFEATSTHHQGMIPSCILYSSLLGTSEDNINEVILYEDVSVLCFQPHPEYSNGSACREVFFNLINYMV